MFEQGGRQELADIEASEVAVIEDFLPAQLLDDEATAAIKAIVVELGATSLKDMGKVMAAVKDRLGSQLDMGKDRKSGVQGKRVYVRVDLGGRRIIKKNTSTINIDLKWRKRRCILLE